jgi:hypothetical protein
MGLGDYLKTLLSAFNPGAEATPVPKWEITAIMADNLNKRGFHVDKTDDPTALVADKEGNYVIVDICDFGQKQLTYDSIAEVKSRSLKYEQTPDHGKIMPVIVGTFTVPEGPDVIAKNNDVEIFQIASNAAPHDIAMYFDHELTRILAEP